jgi:hypothetical protein
LPAASVETEADAVELISRCCEFVITGPDLRPGWLAPELEAKQTIENLYTFGARLEAEYQKMLKERKKT